jgi:phospholipid transport system substrate-binding protein
MALAVSLALAGAYVAGGPLETTRKILQSSNRIVTGEGTREQKLESLKGLLRDFLDTDALGRQSMGKHLDGKTAEQQRRFFDLFRDLFVRTYVQRLLLFDAPDFAYGDEKVTGDRAEIETEIVTPNDRFAVDYALQRTGTGWQATDILIEDVSLAANFRSQFDQALAKSSFDGLLDKLDRKLHGKKD